MIDAEKLHSLEQEATGMYDVKKAEVTPTVAAAKKLFEQREAMFSEIERFLKVASRQKLKEKLEREKKFFLDLIGRRQSQYNRVKAQPPVLSLAFFEQRVLDLSLMD